MPPTNLHSRNSLSCGFEADRPHRARKGDTPSLCFVVVSTPRWSILVCLRVWSCGLHFNFLDYDRTSNSVVMLAIFYCNSNRRLFDKGNSSISNTLMSVAWCLHTDVKGESSSRTLRLVLCCVTPVIVFGICWKVRSVRGGCPVDKVDLAVSVSPFGTPCMCSTCLAFLGGSSVQFIVHPHQVRLCLWCVEAHGETGDTELWTRPMDRTGPLAQWIHCSVLGGVCTRARKVRVVPGHLG